MDTIKEDTIEVTLASEAVLELMRNPKDLVPAAAIAPVVGMNPGVMVRLAKTGRWDRKICNYIVSGRNVKFFRLDFLRKGGFLT